jgi:hypothetical protein
VKDTNFAERKAILETLGIKVVQARDYRPAAPDQPHNRVPHPIDIFTAFKPPFTADEWLAIAQRDGDQYIGGCCGQTGAIQDVVCGWFRDGGQVKIRELAEVAEMCIRHDNKQSPFHDLGVSFDEVVTDAKAWQAGSELADTVLVKHWSNLWFRLAVVWHLVKDSYDDEVEHGIRTDMAPVDKAICTIDHIATALSMHRAFGGDETPTGQTRAQKILMLAKLVPALRYVLNHIDDLALGSTVFEGWALVDLSKGPEVICENGYGLCLYDDRDRMMEVVNLWKSNEAKHEGHVPAYMEIKDRIGIRPVKVDLSSEQGPTFTGPVETP